MGGQRIHVHVYLIMFRTINYRHMTAVALLLLSPQPLGRGYIAIILTKLGEADTACSKLMTEDEYQDYLAKECESSQTVISHKN